MGQRRPRHGKRTKPHAAAPASAAVRSPLPTIERKPPVRYGKPFILLEDAQKATFIYTGAQWVRHTQSIAECRLDCQVKELPQKINGMTRYEVCAPLPSAN
jgi:hypothetical protein